MSDVNQTDTEQSQPPVQPETIPGSGENGTALDYFSGRGSGTDRDSRRINLFGKAVRLRSKAAIQTGPLAPSQSNPSGKHLAFIPSTDNNVLGYNIYRSLTNDPKTGQRIGFISQPPDGQQVGVSDSPSVAGTYWYWAASVNAGGGESARIGIGQLIANGSGPSGFTVEIE